MKKIVLTAMAAMFAIASFAQAPAQTGDKKQDIKELRREKREERKEGDKAKAKELTKEIRSEKEDLSAGRKDLRRDGVKHSYRPTSHQSRRQNHH